MADMDVRSKDHLPAMDIERRDVVEDDVTHGGEFWIVMTLVRLPVHVRAIDELSFNWSSVACSSSLHDGPHNLSIPVELFFLTTSIKCEQARLPLTTEPKFEQVATE